MWRMYLVRKKYPLYVNADENYVYTRVASVRLCEENFKNVHIRVMSRDMRDNKIIHFNTQ